MAKRLLLKNGTVVDPTQNLMAKRDVLIERDGGHGTRDAGRIVAVAENIVAEDAEVIDCTGKLVVPGLVDIHVHFREPGEEHKETIATGSAAAVAGGFTTVCCMPNTKPPLDSVAAVEFMLRRAEEAGLCRVLPIGAISVGLKHEQLTEMAAMKEAGAVAFSDDGEPVQDSGFLRKALAYAKVCDAVVILHCEDKSLTAGGVMNEGLTSLRLGLRGMPRAAEVASVQRAVELAKLTGAKVHIAHVSTKEAVEVIRRAKEQGVQVTAEVTPHHLTLTEEAVGEYDTNAKMNPPLRTAEDVAALRDALAEGVIDCIATDHAPHAVEEKETTFDEAPFGIVGLETAVGVLWTELVHKSGFSVMRLVEAMSTKPCQILGLDGGAPKEGSRADVTVIDPNAEWTVQPEKFRSKGRNTPYAGWTLKGKVMLTICDGQIVFRDL
ncbi:Dihydroorotase [bacterium HR17]|jgi:dihydroorotase|uniref:Dihydroorotase n=1 Tax=Candidatus Fervidibacter japonicus TaxID=2035412 RepID=A0A2H5X9E4_9BACT|nr:Dihydroorotase [bacterium HR17]